jgi:hypothetical protein
VSYLSISRLLRERVALGEQHARRGRWLLPLGWRRRPRRVHGLPLGGEGELKECTLLGLCGWGANACGPRVARFQGHRRHARHSLGPGPASRPPPFPGFPFPAVLRRSSGFSSSLRFQRESAKSNLRGICFSVAGNHSSSGIPDTQDTGHSVNRETRRYCDRHFCYSVVKEDRYTQLI